MPTIVVGIDGSPGSNAALEFAADEASIRHASLHVVAAWEVGPIPIGGPTPIGGLPTVELIEAYRGAADEAARAAQARLDSDWPELARTAEVWEGTPAEVLVSLAKDADLLVVGNRGRGDTASLVLGSVSHHVVQHARCPVVVIPHLWSSRNGASEIHDQSRA